MLLKGYVGNYYIPSTTFITSLQMIKTFFSNANRKTKPTAKFWNKRPTLRDISYNMYRVPFLAWAGGIEKFTNEHGRVNLAAMQARFSDYEKEKLSQAQHDAAEAAWKSYRGDKPYPEDIQIEYNRRYGPKYAWAVDHSGHQVFGQYRVTFVMATGEDSRLEVS